jgi:hypothetical protein
VPSALVRELGTGNAAWSKTRAMLGGPADSAGLLTWATFFWLLGRRVCHIKSSQARFFVFCFSLWCEHFMCQPLPISKKKSAQDEQPAAGIG